MQGKLILISTPIGNRDDLTFRAKKALEEGEYFAVEDTRVFKKLLGLYGIESGTKTIMAFHDHSSEYELEKLLSWLQTGHDVYVLSDAGNPLMSDPAFPLVKRALAAGFEFDAYPGASAVMTALSLSGLPPYPFSFHGFLPREDSKQEALYASLPAGTHLFFEGPSRIHKSLSSLAKSFPDAQVVIVREATKKFQAVHRFLAQSWEQEQILAKGEFVLLLWLESSFETKKYQNLAQQVLSSKGKRKELAKLLAELLPGLSSKDIYGQLQVERPETSS